MGAHSGLCSQLNQVVNSLVIWSSVGERDDGEPIIQPITSSRFSMGDARDGQAYIKKEWCRFVGFHCLFEPICRPAKQSFLEAQRAALETAPAAGANAVAPESAAAIVAVDTVMRETSSSEAAEVRSLRAGSELTPTGQREGLFIEVADNYGTTGWVSVEDME